MSERPSESPLSMRQIESDPKRAILLGMMPCAPSERFYILREVMEGEDENHLRAMPYEDFLDTYYWEIVRNYVLYSRSINPCGTIYYRCEGECIPLPSSWARPKSEFHIHHKTYEHRGTEYKYLEDLSVLCADCHAAIHGKKAKA